MRFSLHPQQRPELRFRSLSIHEILNICEHSPGERPPLEYYFSPTRKEAFVRDFLKYLNTELLEVRHSGIDSDQYLVFLFCFQFIGPLLEIPTEKELGIFYRVLQKKFEIDDIDLNLHFSMDDEEGRLEEKEALESFEKELKDTYEGMREVRHSVRKRLKCDAMEAIMDWQRDRSLPSLAEAFGRSIVIPAFFSFSDKKLISFYRNATPRISYRVTVPKEIS